MRIIFINAHCNPLLMNSVDYYLYGIKAPQKYGMLFRALLEDPKVEIWNYVSKRASFFPHYIWAPFHTLISLLTCKLVFRKNGEIFKKIPIITSVDKVQKDDVVIGFVHSKWGCADIEKFPCKRIIHLNQYATHDLFEMNKYLSFCDDFILEADVMKKGNYLLRAHISPNAHISVLPYIVSNRFTMTKAFHERKNKAVVTGTIACFPDDSRDYTKHYNTRLIHRMRQVIYDNKAILSECLDSFLSPYCENKKILSVNNTDGKMSRLIKQAYNLIIAKNGKQKKYFSFDIVEKYNEYMMAVVPEEIIGVPAIGAFESMACGCAYIGIDHSMYTDLGLKPNYHYITYDGTLKDLKRTILYYQMHNDELCQIANNGREYVLCHFNEKMIESHFVEILKEHAK